MIVVIDAPPLLMIRRLIILNFTIRIILSILLLSVCYPITDCIVLSPENIEDYSTLYPLDETNTSQQNWCNEMLVEYDDDCPRTIDVNFDSDTLISPYIFQDNISTKEVTFDLLWGNLEFMKWDSAKGRYKVGLSYPNSETATMYDNTDIYDSLIFIGFIDTNQYSIDNLTILDRNEWETHYDTTYTSMGEPIIMDTTLTFSQITISEDSTMFRINGDCNQNLIWDAAEEYIDFGSDWCPDSLETGDGECNAVLFGESGEPCNCFGSINVDFEEGSDPNGDNWRDCGWDGLCSEDSGYEGADFSGTEGNGIWDLNEGLENNGQYDFNLGLGEYFEDRVNGVIDPAEFFFDADSNGEHDSFTEPFEDRNCNGIRDLAEVIDAGNGIWDRAELFTDTNIDGEYNSGEPLYIISDKPETFLVDYPDQNLENGVGFKTFQADTTITLFSHYNDNGDPQFNIFDDLIVTIADSTTRTAIYADVDSIVTVYTNVKIEFLSGTVEDYHVTKVKWFEPIMDELAVDTVRFYDYDYHIFKIAENGNILKITHPEYFNHYGYFNNLAALESGLWEQSQINEEVYIYTRNNELRAEEYYYHDKMVETSLAEFRVEEKFEIEFCDGDGNEDAFCSVDRDGNPIDGLGDDETVSVPIRQLRFNDTGSGSYLCLLDSIVVNNSEDCSADSILTNVFKIIRTRTVTMIGNGVELGTRNTIWLAKGLGIVKDKLEIRWSEPYWEVKDSGWKEYTRLELSALRSHDPGLLRSIFQPVKIIRLDQFGNEAALEFDPYQASPTFGLHRLRLPIE